MGLGIGDLTCDGCDQRYGDQPNWPKLHYRTNIEAVEQEATRAWGWRVTADQAWCPRCIAAAESARADVPEIAMA